MIKYRAKNMLMRYATFASFVNDFPFVAHILNGNGGNDPTNAYTCSLDLFDYERSTVTSSLYR